MSDLEEDCPKCKGTGRIKVSDYHGSERDAFCDVCVNSLGKVPSEQGYELITFLEKYLKVDGRIDRK